MEFSEVHAAVQTPPVDSGGAFAHGGAATLAAAVEAQLMLADYLAPTPLARLRAHTGDASEPPADLLELVARRLLAARSAQAQPTSASGRLSDLGAAAPSEAASLEGGAGAETPDPLPVRLPPIRVRVPLTLSSTTSTSSE